MMAFLRKILVTLLLTSLLVAPAAGAMASKQCCCESQQAAESCCETSTGTCCATGNDKTSAAPKGCCSSSGMTLGCQTEMADNCCFVCSDCKQPQSNQTLPVSVDQPLQILLFYASSAIWDEPVRISAETAFDHSLPTDPGPPIRVRFAVWLI